jgi:two-component system LytT family response regulator
MLRAIIIEDEKEARDALGILLASHFSSQIELIDSCDSVQEGYQSIMNLNPDVVFLDINLPVLGGFDLLERIGKFSFEIIFVTAYNDYAVKAFRYNAIDYLLKPVSIDELREAINKVIRKHSMPSKYEGASLSKVVKNASQIIVVPSSEGMLFLNVDDILYCEAQNTNTVIFRADHGSVNIPKTLKEIEDLLQNFDFFRIHRSYLVNFRKIQSYQRKNTTIKILSGQELPVGRLRKERFEDKLKELSL